MPEQQSELNQTSQPNTQQDAVSGLLSLLLDQWEEQEIDTVCEDIPEQAAAADEDSIGPEIANLSVSLEGLAEGEELQTEPNAFRGEITVPEISQEVVQPLAPAEGITNQTVNLDAILFECFDLIPIEGEHASGIEAEVEEVCTEVEVAELAHGDVRLGEPPEDLETWYSSPPSSHAFVEEVETVGELEPEINCSELLEPVIEFEMTTDTLLVAGSEAPQQEAVVEVHQTAALAEQTALVQPSTLPLEPSRNLGADEESLDAIEETELDEADLRTLFDSLMSESTEFDEITAEPNLPVEVETEPDEIAFDTADPLPTELAEPGEPYEPISAELDASLLGLLLGGISAIEQTHEEPASEPETQPVVVGQPVAKAEPPASKGPTERFVVFRIGEASYAVPLQRVVETDRMPRVTFVPGLPSSLRGISNLRGDIIPIIDLRHVLGLGDTEITVVNRLLVVRATGESSVGLIVDGLAGLGAFWVDRSPREQGPDQTGKTEVVNPQLLNGCGQHKGQPVEVIDLDKVLLATELQELSA